MIRRHRQLPVFHRNVFKHFASVPFLFPLKTSGFLTFSGKIEIEHWEEYIKTHFTQCSISQFPENVRKPEVFNGTLARYGLIQSLGHMNRILFPYILQISLLFTVLNLAAKIKSFFWWYLAHLFWKLWSEETLSTKLSNYFFDIF